jgi:hypothetical protein
VKYIPLLFFLLSCSQSFHCRKCLSGGNVIYDTLHVRDTLYSERVKTDTIFSTKELTIRDTIIKKEGKLTIRYVKMPGDTVFLDGVCESDTLYITKDVVVPIEVKTGWQTGKVILCLIVALLLGGLIVKLFS